MDATSSRPPSLAAIIAVYRRDKLKEDLAGEWGIVVFHRLPSFVIAWVLARLGVGPTPVTVAALVLNGFIPFAATLMPPVAALVAICMMAYFFMVLDCVDGTLARTLGLHSTFGQYLDATGDVLHRFTFYASLGLVADRVAPPVRLGSVEVTWLVFGLVSAWLALFARATRVYGGTLRKPEDAIAAVPALGPPGRGTSLPDIVFSAISGIDSLMPLIALLLWWLGDLTLVFYYVLAYSLLDALYSVVVVGHGLRR